MRALLLKILKWKLRLLAKLTLWRYKPRIIGITGSVGKTSTKEAIRTVLGSEKRVRASLKSFNNELGLPFTILGNWELGHGPFFWLKVIFVGFLQILLKNPRYPQILILEYGVDRPGDMKYLLDIARPEIGIITAMGEIPVHVEFFDGPEGVLREKSKLIGQLPATGFAILNADEPEILEIKKQTRARVITFGFSENADMQITNLTNHFENGQAALTFKLTYNGNFLPVRIENVLGRAPAYAGAIAAITGLVSGMNLVKIADALTNYKPPAGRFKILKGVKDTIIIDDTYNSSPVALEEALGTLSNLKANRKIAVLGDMLEIGKYTLEAHESIGRITAKCVDLLITVGMRAKFIADSAIVSGMAQNSVFIFENLEEAGKLLQEKMEKGDLILIKGSQGVRMEKIIKEIMAEPERARELLVRQGKIWLAKKGLYG